MGQNFHLMSLLDCVTISLSNLNLLDSHISGLLSGKRPTNSSPTVPRLPWRPSSWMWWPTLIRIISFGYAITSEVTLRPSLMVRAVLLNNLYCSSHLKMHWFFFFFLFLYYNFFLNYLLPHWRHIIKQGENIYFTR